jgi:hypothetical protein
MSPYIVLPYILGTCTEYCRWQLLRSNFIKLVRRLFALHKGLRRMVDVGIMDTLLGSLVMRHHRWSNTIVAVQVAVGAV